jgi:hypothetical protein
MVLPGLTEERLDLLLRGSVPTEHGDGALVQMKRPRRQRRLLVLLGHVALGGEQHRLPDRHGRRGQVDLAPAQTQDLGPAHSGGGEELPDDVEVVRARAVEERPQLLGGPRPHPPPPCGPHDLHRRRVGEQGDVALHPPPPHRVVECLAQHRVDARTDRGDPTLIEGRLTVTTPKGEAERAAAVGLVGRHLPRGKRISIDLAALANAIAPATPGGVAAHATGRRLAARAAAKAARPTVRQPSVSNFVQMAFFRHLEANT